MVIDIIETNYTGHHLKNLEIIILSFLNNNYSVILSTSQDTCKSEEYQKIIKPIENKIKVDKINLSGFNSRSKYIRNFINAIYGFRSILKYRADKYFFPTIDPVFFSIGLLSLVLKWNNKKKKKIEGILFQEGDYLYNHKKEKLGEKLRLLLTKNILKKGPFYRVLFLNEQVFDYLKNNLKSSTILSKCPDPVEKSPTKSIFGSRKILGLSSKYNIIGMVGIIDERKGVDLLIDALEEYNFNRYEYVLLYGKQSPIIKNKIGILREKKPEVYKRLLVNDSFIDTEIMLHVINSLNCVLAIYPRHVGSSGIVIRASAARKPVLGSNYGWIGYVMEKYSLGYSIDPTDKIQLINGIKWAFSKPRYDYEKSYFLYKKNTIERFINVLLNKTYIKDNIS